MLSHIQLFVTPWTAAHQASLSFTILWSLLKLMSIELVIPSNHFVLCHPLLLLPSIFLSIRVFNVSDLHIRWPKYWSFSFSISPSNEYLGLIFFRIDWFDSLQSKRLSRVSSNSTIQKHQSFGTQSLDNFNGLKILFVQLIIYFVTFRKLFHEFRSWITHINSPEKNFLRNYMGFYQLLSDKVTEEKKLCFIRFIGYLIRFHLLCQF